MTKERLLAYYELHKEINEVERNIFPKKYYGWNGFVWFEDLRNKFNNLYKLDDSLEYDLLSFFESIVEDMQVFDFELLTEEDVKKLTSKEGHLCILSSEEKNYPYAIIKFNTIDEVADYVLRNYNNI